MLRWQIGDLRVARIPEVIPLVNPANFFVGANLASIAAQRWWLMPRFIDGADRLRLSIHAFVVESAGQRILIDTCVGNDKKRQSPTLSGMRTPFLEQLEDAGYPPESIDTVLCTHLHFDHVGWNTTLIDGRWCPTFANARYLFAREEWEHWQAREAAGEPEVLDSGAVFADSVQPIVDAGLADLVEGEHRITDEVFLEPTPGHTPGHVSVRLSSRGEEGVVTGDLAHSPLQLAEPGWHVHADVDPELAATTRTAFFARHETAATLVLGSHFAPPTAGRIVKNGDAWRLEAD